MCMCWWHRAHTGILDCTPLSKQGSWVLLHGANRDPGFHSIHCRCLSCCMPQASGSSWTVWRCWPVAIIPWTCGLPTACCTAQACTCGSPRSAQEPRWAFCMMCNPPPGCQPRSAMLQRPSSGRVSPLSGPTWRWLRAAAGGNRTRGVPLANSPARCCPCTGGQVLLAGEAQMAEGQLLQWPVLHASSVQCWWRGSSLRP